MTFVEAISTLVKFPGAIPDDPVERLAFCKDILMEVDAKWGIKDEVDELIDLPPGLEQMSDMAIKVAYDQYAPMLLSAILKNLT